MPQNDKALLTRHKNQQVEFVVIGGVCGVLHGVPLITYDLDICCPFSADNLFRIEASVKDLHPYHRLAINKLPLKLTDSLISRLKNLYLQTDLGILDCSRGVAGIGNYSDVLNRSVTHMTSYGEFRILTIEALIAAKEAAGRERDLYALKIIRAIKERTDGV